MDIDVSDPLWTPDDALDVNVSMGDFQEAREAWWSFIQLIDTNIVLSVIRNTRSPSAAWKALKETLSPIATGQIAALDAELASLSLIHREHPCLLLTRFERIAARLAELREPIGNSTMLSRLLTSLPDMFE